jgi:uncharacterized membrane protein YdjX (TVP38/TMEM64 family)
MGKMTENQRKIASFFALLIFLLFFIFLTVYLGKPIVSFFEDPDLFRDYVDQKGWVARLVFVGMMTLQVVVALIPGEPLEISAGVAFGGIEGTLLVMAGIALGSALVFLLVRLLGVKMVEVFFSPEKIQSLRLKSQSRKFSLILFFLMILPGTPKDLISYFAGLTNISFTRWVLFATLARIPSVVTSTVGGDALGEENYIFATVVFIVAAFLSIGGWFAYYCLIEKKKNKKSERE